MYLCKYFSVGTHNLNFVSHCVLTREEVRRQRARASSQDKKNGVNIDTTFSFYVLLSMYSTTYTAQWSLFVCSHPLFIALWTARATLASSSEQLNNDFFINKETSSTHIVLLMTKLLQFLNVNASLRILPTYLYIKVKTKYQIQRVPA